MHQPKAPQIRSKPIGVSRLVVTAVIAFSPLTLAAQSKVGSQLTEPPLSPRVLPALPGKVDLGKAVNAGEAGLVADSDEDQSGKLASLLAAVASDPAQNTVYVPAGRYYIAKAIGLRPGVNLIGDGMGRTVFYRDDSEGYLVRPGGHGDFKKALIANLSFRNKQRTLLMGNVHHLRFHNVEFEGGIVRLEKASHVTLEGCFFNRNLGKGGYASSNCSNMRLVHNRFLSIEKGSINLSGHEKSYVAYNHITADKLIDSGYAGIRLPNTASNNLIEHNFIENHGRGLFVLTYSSHNILRHNTVKSTKYQGVLVQSPHNRIEHNMIIDAGLAAIRVSDAHYDGKYPSSIASGNRILHNLVTDTRDTEADSQVGLIVSSSNTTVMGNIVDRRFGRSFMDFRGGSGNTKKSNIYR